VIYLPDTNVFSRFLRERDVRLRDKLEAELEFCRLSPICLFELEYGAAKRPDLTMLRRRIERLKAIVPAASDFGEDAAFHAGMVRAQLENLKPNAQPIGPYDILLAGQALSLGAVLVTAYVREFYRIAGLQVENW
jgi:tRNA(fMet)-specific endonuclease VapC